MTAIPHNARITLARTFSNNNKIVRTAMNENMQKLLADCDTNKSRAKLWERNPMTGAKVVSEKYNDRF